MRPPLIPLIPIVCLDEIGFLYPTRTIGLHRLKSVKDLIHARPVPPVPVVVIIVVLIGAPRVERIGVIAEVVMVDSVVVAP